MRLRPVEEVRLNEYDREECWDLVRETCPDLSREEFEQKWTEHQHAKAQRRAQLDRH